jgi:hypothetical protein
LFDPVEASRLLHVDFKTASHNPDWVLDGASMLPFVRPGGDPHALRPEPLVFSFGSHFNGSQQAIIDNDWKILTRQVRNSCNWCALDLQLPQPLC